MTRHWAGGGWLANVARILTIVIALVLTIYKNRIWKPLPVEAENILEVESGNNFENESTLRLADTVLTA